LMNLWWFREGLQILRSLGTILITLYGRYPLISPVLALIVNRFNFSLCLYEL
jgi:hypothetical protein